MNLRVILASVYSTEMRVISCVQFDEYAVTFKSYVSCDEEEMEHVMTRGRLHQQQFVHGWSALK